MSLSVVIICKNEEPVIGETLESVIDFADEVIVIDSGSTDKTLDIVRSFDVRLFEYDWPGYAEQKNRGIEKSSCDWILTLDADEVVSEKLKTEIKNKLEKADKYTAYRIPNKLMYFGKYIRSPKRYPIVLFRRDKGKFNNARVHERVIVSGKVGRLKGYILHNSYQDLYCQVETYNRYARLWAEDHAAKRVVTFSIVTHSFWSFIQQYIVRGSFLDGWRGLVLSVLNGNYTFVKYAMLLTKKHNK